MDREEVEVKYLKTSGTTSEGNTVKTMKVKRFINKRAKVNNVGLVEGTDYLVIYSAPTLAQALKFFQIFITPSEVMDKNDYFYPYFIEEEGITHLILKKDQFMKSYRRVLHRVLKTILRYMQYDTVKKSLFELYTYFIYTWKGHYYKDHILQHIDVADLNKAVLHYSYPEKLNIVDTRGTRDEEETKENRNKGQEKIQKSNRVAFHKDRPKETTKPIKQWKARV